jgi:hypothetical protein
MSGQAFSAYYWPGHDFHRDGGPRRKLQGWEHALIFETPEPTDAEQYVRLQREDAFHDPDLVHDYPPDDWGR